MSCGLNESNFPQLIEWVVENLLWLWKIRTLGCGKLEKVEISGKKWKKLENMVKVENGKIQKKQKKVGNVEKLKSEKSGKVEKNRKYGKSRKSRKRGNSEKNRKKQKKVGNVEKLKSEK